MGQGPEGSPDHRHPESVLTQHRMVVAESFLREDAATEDRDYSFLYQLTHITRDRGALTHDDRVDAVAGAVAHFQRAMMMDVDQAAKAMNLNPAVGGCAEWPNRRIGPLWEQI